MTCLTLIYVLLYTKTTIHVCYNFSLLNILCYYFINNIYISYLYTIIKNNILIFEYIFYDFLEINVLAIIFYTWQKCYHENVELKPTQPIIFKNTLNENNCCVLTK